MSDTLLTPAQAAQAFGVHVKTLLRWANAGKLHPVRTLGGHRRYFAEEVAAMTTMEENDA